MIDHLIGILCLVYVTFVFRNKKQTNPGFKVLGLSLDRLLLISYLGIVCFVTLFLVTWVNS
jgi:hypothetical protein